jgi:hypothetical protein
MNLHRPSGRADTLKNSTDQGCRKALTYSIILLLSPLHLQHHVPAFSLTPVRWPMES